MNRPGGGGAWTVTVRSGWEASQTWKICDVDEAIMDEEQAASPTPESACAAERSDAYFARRLRL